MTTQANIQEFRDATGREIQPYYAAYMLEHGFGTLEQAREGRTPTQSNVDYMLWIQDRWAEFERVTGRKHNGPRRSYASEFTDWLQARQAA